VQLMHKITGSVTKLVGVCGRTAELRWPRCRFSIALLLTSLPIWLTLTPSHAKHFLSSLPITFRYWSTIGAMLHLASRVTMLLHHVRRAFGLPLVMKLTALEQRRQ
jgi:hypothetical protein